jgi:hypothetical protein
MNDETKFEAWMSAVDAYLIDATGMGVDDLPDFAYRDHFDSDLTPRFVSMCLLNDIMG